jgi:hypothetical protein
MRLSVPCGRAKLDVTQRAIIRKKNERLCMGYEDFLRIVDHVDGKCLFQARHGSSQEGLGMHAMNSRPLVANLRLER